MKEGNKFGLNWCGKEEARKIALLPPEGELCPCPEDSADWDNTQNLFIEGDNLEVLKLLQKNYAPEIKLIYIDPPYNTGGDFTYSDRYHDNLKSHQCGTEQVEGEVGEESSNIEASGRKHTNWLNMMWPRLKLARNLLKDDGLIIIHIDEHEFAYLTILMDEIFGPENSLGPIVWDKRNPKGDASRIAVQHEYLVLYAKEINILRGKYSLKRSKENAGKMLSKAESLFSKLKRESVPDDLRQVARKYDLPIHLNEYKRKYSLEQVSQEYREWLKRQDLSGGEAAYRYIDEEGRIFRTVSMAWPNKKKAPDEYFVPLIHPVTQKPCPVPERGWRNPPSTMKDLFDKSLIIFGPDENKQPERKYFLGENVEENIPSIIPFGGSDDALLKKLGVPFDNPKPIKFVKTVLDYFLAEDGVVLDFFAGSGTTAHACLEINVDKKTQYRYIMVQLPETLDPKRRGQKAAHKFCQESGVPENIAEISKERLRRAVALIKEENPGYQGDLGFKVLKLVENSTNN